jgi:hypothetical protein
MDYTKEAKVLPIYSLEYGYIPTVNTGKKVVYATTNFPPTDLYVGQVVFLYSTSQNFIVPQDPLVIKDIVGTRIILQPFNSHTWDGKDHGWYWGYSTRQYDACPGLDRNWTYGTGKPVIFLYY